MTRHLMSIVLLTLFSVIFCFALNARNSNHFYYILEFDEGSLKGAEIIDIEGDSAGSPPAGFKEISESELHEKGYQTADEILAETDQANINGGEAQPLGIYWKSWINPSSNGSLKRVQCCSQTGRSGWPGYCFCRGTTNGTRRFRRRNNKFTIE